MNLENILSPELVELQIESNREGIKRLTTKVYLLIKKWMEAKNSPKYVSVINAVYTENKMPSDFDRELTFFVKMSTSTTALFKTCCFYKWLSENFKKPGFDRNLYLGEIGYVSLNNLGINIDVQHNTRIRIVFVLTRKNDLGEKFSRFIGSDENQEIVFAKEEVVRSRLLTSKMYNQVFGFLGYMFNIFENENRDTEATLPYFISKKVEDVIKKSNVHKELLERKFVISKRSGERLPIDSNFNGLSAILKS